MNLKITRHEVITLILSVIVPFIIIIGVLFPFSNGIHGTTYSEGGNDYVFNGEIVGDIPEGINETSEGYPYDVRVNYSGHFKGDAYIEDNTGWVFCNGKVRYSGELHIKNAEFDYYIQEEQGFGCLGPLFNHQEIEINGDKGEMQDGMPYYFLGIFGSAFGVILWLAWYISKKARRPCKTVAIVSTFCGFIGGPSIFLLYNTSDGGLFGMLSFFCAIIFIIPVAIIFVALYKYSQKKQETLEIDPTWFLIIGILLLTSSIMIFMYPPQYMGGDVYSKGTALGSVYFGIVGIMSSAGLIGAWFGRISYLKNYNITPLDESYKSENN